MSPVSVCRPVRTSSLSGALTSLPLRSPLAPPANAGGGPRSLKSSSSSQSAQLVTDSCVCCHNLSSISGTESFFFPDLSPCPTAHARGTRPWHQHSCRRARVPATVQPRARATAPWSSSPRRQRRRRRCSFSSWCQAPQRGCPRLLWAAPRDSRPVCSLAYGDRRRPGGPRTPSPEPNTRARSQGAKRSGRRPQGRQMVHTLKLAQHGAPPSQPPPPPPPPWGAHSDAKPDRARQAAQAPRQYGAGALKRGDQGTGRVAAPPGEEVEAGQ